LSAMIGLVHRRCRAWSSTLVLMGALLMGCGPAAPLPTGPYQPFTGNPGESFSLIVVNMDGPTVDVFVDGARAAHSSCAPNGQDVPVEVVSTAPFPWHIEVRRTTGEVVAAFDAIDTNGPMTVLVRTGGASLIPRGQNPGPAPAPSCAP